MADRFTILSKGNSMALLLRDGDLVEFKHIPSNTFKCNDIVLIYNNGLFVTHRIIYISRKYVITRGDNNRTADKKILIENILAKAIRFKRDGKWHYIQDVYSSQSLAYLMEIRKLTLIINRLKIRHVFLKGVMISLHYESHIPQRIYADCDILIQRKQYEQIKAVFNKLGYKKVINTSINAISEEESPEISFIKIVDKIPVVFDVHLEPVFLMTKLQGMDFLYQKRRRDQLGEVLIDQSKKVKIGGSSYSLLNPSLQILYLALHIFHHNYTDIVRLRLLDSVIRKITKRKGIWKLFIKTTKGFSLQNYIFPVLIQLRMYLNTPIPQSVFSSLKTDWVTHAIGKWAAESTDVFSEDNRIRAGIKRFFLILLLSPEPFYKKILLCFYPSTVKSVVVVVFLKIYGILKK